MGYSARCVVPVPVSPADVWAILAIGSALVPGAPVSPLPVEALASSLVACPLFLPVLVVSVSDWDVEVVI